MKDSGYEVNDGISVSFKQRVGDRVKAWRRFGITHYFLDLLLHCGGM